MAEASIPVDLFNPGQVFACIGFAEAADVLLGHAQGVFDWSDPARSVFRLRANGDESPVLRVLRFIDEAKAQAVAPAGGSYASAWTSKWGPLPTNLAVEDGYPFPAPNSPATLVCLLSGGRCSLGLDYWGDVTKATGRDNAKFWAGMRGKPGSVVASEALELIRGSAAFASDDPFALGRPQNSSFRLDWRRDYVPIHAGFSLNEHADIDTLGFPLVELLGAVGLSNARPRRLDWHSKLIYGYAVAGRETSGESTWLPLSFLRSALGMAPLPFPMRQFKMLLDWPGQEDQARSITTVTEENLA